MMRYTVKTIHFMTKKNPTLKSMMIEQGIATEDDFKRKKSKKEGES